MIGTAPTNHGEMTIDKNKYNELLLFVESTDHYCAYATISTFVLGAGRYIDLGGDGTFRIQCTDNGIKLNQFSFNSTTITDGAFIVYGR